MELYRTTWYYSSAEWADCHSGMLVDMHYLKEEVCGEGKRQWNSTWFDENSMSSDHFFLTEMYLKPEFRQKGLGYKAMHTGLIECGASHNFVYVYPSKREEDMGFKYLKKFYKGMMKVQDTVQNMERLCVQFIIWRHCKKRIIPCASSGTVHCGRIIGRSCPIICSSAPHPMPLHFSTGNAKLNGNTLIFNLPAGKLAQVLAFKSMAIQTPSGRKYMTKHRIQVFCCFV